MSSFKPPKYFDAPPQSWDLKEFLEGELAHASNTNWKETADAYSRAKQVWLKSLAKLEQAGLASDAGKRAHDLLTKFHDVTVCQCVHISYVSFFAFQCWGHPAMIEHSDSVCLPPMLLVSASALTASGRAPDGVSACWVPSCMSAAADIELQMASVLAGFKFDVGASTRLLPNQLQTA